MLADLEQLTAPEIAQALEMNLNTVYWKLRMARLDFEGHLFRRRGMQKAKPVQEEASHERPASRRASSDRSGQPRRSSFAARGLRPGAPGSNLYRATLLGAALAFARWMASTLKAGGAKAGLTLHLVLVLVLIEPGRLWPSWRRGHFG